MPEKLSELIAALAGVLEAHMKALDLTDANSRKEDEAYAQLVRKHREAAAHLQATAREMAGYRNMQMGRHDMEAMAGPEPLTAFERYVRVKHEHFTLLQETLAEDEKMLAMMRGTRNTG